MKNKKFVGLIIGIVSIVLAVILYVVDPHVKESEDNYREISAKEIKGLGSKKNEFVYVYGKDCTACKAFKPILNKALNQTDKKINKLDYQNKDNRKILQSHNLYSTPDILVIRKGKVVKRYEGARELKETIQILEKNSE
ncbi:MAG: thioredoxin family protein [Lactobacillaceae bacterium]